MSKKNNLSKLPQVSNFMKYRFLLHELVIRDIKVKYKRSVLGVLWTLFNPMFYMIILNLVFNTLFQSNIENFPVYLLCGYLFFGFFSESTSVAITSVYSNASLLRKVYLPKYLFPASKVIFSLFNLFVSFLALIIVMVATGAPFYKTSFLMLIPVLYLFVFSLGISLLLSCAAVFFRDLVHLYGIILAALQFLTPIFYPTNILPDYIKPYVELNPIYQAIYMLRQLIMLNEVPSLTQHFNMGVWTLCTLVIGLFTFYKKQDKFVLYA